MKKGKNISASNRGQRRKSDFYETPFSMTEQLLEIEKFDGYILEPACGNGAIVKACFNKGVYIHNAYDINVNPYSNPTNFLTYEFRNYENILTNPPFSLALKFIQKAKSIYTKKIAFLLPLSYLHGQKRFEAKIFSELKCIYVFTRYPMLGEPLREDGKYNTGFIVYAWYVWEKGWKNEPVIRWIDNNQYVLREKKVKKAKSCDLLL